MTAVQNVSGYLPPSRSDLANNLLNDVYDKVNKEMLKILLAESDEALSFNAKMVSPIRLIDH